MFSDKARPKGRDGKKRKLKPALSVLLILCYLAVFIWYFVRGFGDEPDIDAASGEIASTATLPSPYVPTAVVSAPESADVEDITLTPVYSSPPVKVKGLYVAAWYAGIDSRMEHYIELCDTTDINALVIDVKDDQGNITFITGTEGLSGASMYIIPDIETILWTMRDRGIYSIARIVCFLDPVCSVLHPELAIHNAWGEPWQDGRGYTWLDPYKTGVWDYIAAVAREAARVGFDEVQLDYVRFPSDGNLSNIDYGPAGAEKTKTEIISEFVAYIRSVLAEEGVRLSADVFGIIAISSVDAESIGQDPALLLGSADYLCPMIYPSHFANRRQNGTGQIINDVLFEAPDLEPYEVVYNILLGVRTHLDADDDSQAIIRPYLQDFTAEYLGEDYYQDYTAQQVLEQIRAVYDAGFDEWILWNHISVYSEDAFDAP